MIASTAGKVVNLLNVNVPAPEPQILLKVRFASVDRTRLKQLGINFASGSWQHDRYLIGTKQFSGVTWARADRSVPEARYLFGIYPGIGSGQAFRPWRTKGLAEVLAEPNVLAKNGHQASFLAGGEYPYPVCNLVGQAGRHLSHHHSNKQYGVLLAFIPTITNRGTIRLQVAPEVSALDYANAVDIGGARSLH